jgi:hypothetical protein
MIAEKYRYPYLHTYRDRHGRVRIYVRRPGFPLVAIEEKIGTPAFRRAYLDALNNSSNARIPTVRRRKPERSGAVVYFARSKDLIKIGFSTDVHGRMSTLSTAVPTEITLLLTLPGTRHFEQRLHRRFKAHRVNGEWFRASPEILEFITSRVNIAGLNVANLSCKPTLTEL